MRALRYHGPGDLRVDEVPEPTPGPRQALVRVSLAGLCGTDLLVYAGGYEPSRVPMVMGHEFVGEVVALGTEVTGVTLGDRVVAEASWPCGTCRGCLVRPRRPCSGPIALGRTVDGCFAEYTVLPAEVLHLVGADVPDRAAQAFVTVATTAKAVARAHRDGTHPTSVVGTGHGGLLMVQLLSHSAPPPTVIGTRANRLALARSAGAGELFDVRDPASRETLQDRIDLGGLTRVSIDATGTGEGFGFAIGATSSSGTVIVYSIFRSPETVPNLDLIYRRELTILGSRGAGGCWEEASRLLGAREVDPAALTREPVALEDGPALFRAVADKDIPEPRPLLTMS